MEGAAGEAEEGEAASEGGSVGRGTRATSVGGRDTGPSTARDEVMPQDANTKVIITAVCLLNNKEFW